MRISSPALLDDCLDLAPPTRFGRRATVAMWRAALTYAVHDDAGTLLAIGYLWPHSSPNGTWRELCLALAPDARRHLRALIGAAQLILDELAQDGVMVEARISPGHLPGERMARLVGFAPVPDRPSAWTYVWR